MELLFGIRKLILSVLLIIGMSVTLIPFSLDKVSVLLSLFCLFSLASYRLFCSSIAGMLGITCIVFLTLLVLGSADFSVQPHASFLFVFYFMCLLLYTWLHKRTTIFFINCSFIALFI